MNEKNKMTASRHCLDSLKELERESIQQNFLAVSCVTLNPVAQLCGAPTLQEALSECAFADFAKKAMYYEIMPAMELPQVQRLVMMQCTNTSLKDVCLDDFLTLHCLRKQAWKIYVLPLLRAYMRRYNHLPQALLVSLAAQLLCDKVQQNTLHDVLSDTKRWGVSLTQMAGLESAVQSILFQIQQQGILFVLHNIGD